MNSQEPIIVFDDSVKDKLMKSLGLKENKEGKLEDSDGKTITNQDFDPITTEEFGGILKGSKLCENAGRQQKMFFPIVSQNNGHYNPNFPNSPTLLRMSCEDRDP